MKLRYWLRTLFSKIEKILRYLSAFGGGIILVKISEGWGEAYLRRRGMLYVLIVILIINAILIIDFAYFKINEQIERVRIVAHFYSRVDRHDGESIIYEPLLRLMRKAKKSIQIVSSQSNLNATSTRTGYYKELKKILEEKKYGSHPFIYERILQVEKPQERKLEKSQVDNGTLDHCRYIVKNLAQESGVSQFTIKQVENVTTAFVIIDDKEVAIFLPWIESDDNGLLAKRGHGKAIFLHDNEGELVTQMRSMYQVINNHARLVQEVET
jgi:hypothetical protein